MEILGYFGKSQLKFCTNVNLYTNIFNFEIYFRTIGAALTHLNWQEIRCTSDSQNKVTIKYLSTNQPDTVFAVGRSALAKKIVDYMQNYKVSFKFF